mmetsp:Transcript_26924/g.58869  ORF Transcript_26924/g.58869 Transcript_26924/m.58869 type:complete len:191 (+) Transcript_26924:385-957(+)|eukprot:CAMPEP_0178490018 /NCGR_PEP_ID=MMETSP0696-20121128/10675_1 /TAXON_ID=265572 /ORGANISM="Extubocellulus spinifer, Strain CCMP396" /LENGTH=190 /DNA_ID=CAMNT_0020117837 /DNA_START=224 /DNA_END=799 /DNA_ORIENTATION=+
MGVGSGGKKEDRFSVTGEFTVEVPVPPSILWETVADVDSTPHYIYSVVSVERIDGSLKGDELRVGTKWKEVRQYQGRDISMVKTVHGVGSKGSPYPRIFAVNVNFPGTSLQNTSTIIVSPGVASVGSDDKVEEASTSLMAGTFVGLPSGLFFKLKMIIFGRSIRKSTREMFLRELDDIAVESKRRYEASR